MAPPFDFPNTPSVDQVYAPVGGPSYRWTGTAWVKQSGGGGGGASIEVSDTAPASPADKTLWYESDSGGLFLRLTDANGVQWVQVNGSATFPLPPSDNGEYVMVNGVWRLKEQNFNLEGLSQQDIVVPSNARMCSINGIISSSSATVHYNGLRASGDGVNFASTSGDYTESGATHNTGSSGYASVPAGGVAQVLLTQAQDATNSPESFSVDLNVVRGTTPAVWGAKTYSKSYHTAASTIYRTWWGWTFISSVGVGGTGVMQLKALRIFISAGTWAAGSSANVRWMY